MVFGSWTEIALTENHIQGPHQQLLQLSEKDGWHRGHYKKFPNNVAAFDEAGQQIDIVFETATPFDTPRRMEELCAWLEDARRAVCILCFWSPCSPWCFLKSIPFKMATGASAAC